MADYDKAIELVPHFAEAYSNRGALLHARNNPTRRSPVMTKPSSSILIMLTPC